MMAKTYQAPQAATYDAEICLLSDDKMTLVNYGWLSVTSITIPPRLLIEMYLEIFLR